MAEIKDRRSAAPPIATENSRRTCSSRYADGRHCRFRSPRKGTSVLVHRPNRIGRRGGNENSPSKAISASEHGRCRVPTISRGAWAQTYPNRPVTMVVPFPAGGPTDIVGRIVAERMTGPLGQPVIIENVSGANGTIGVGRVARAAPDGYTICVGLWGTHVVNGAIYSLRYDLRTDFEPISLIVGNPVMIFGKNGIPAKDLKELIAWLKANPDKASQGTTTAGTHALGAFFQKETGTRFQFVPYRGTAPAIQELVTGQIDLVFDSAANMSQVQAGNIKAYATTNNTRLALSPDVPTVGEFGLSTLSFTSWYGFFAPKGTPKEVISRLNAAAADALDDATVRHRLTEINMELFPRDQWTPEALGTLVKAEIEKWWPIIKAANIKSE